MTIRELLDRTSWKNDNPDLDLSRNITGGYAGDLLSWVMGRAEAGQAWVTIMSNINVVAVAALTGVSCVILAEGVEPDPGVAERALEKGINLLGTGSPAFAACLAVGQVL